MDDFKLNYYFNLYKDSPVSSRHNFRGFFNKQNGQYDKIQILIEKIEKYQINKYGKLLVFPTQSKIY